MARYGSDNYYHFVCQDLILYKGPRAYVLEIIVQQGVRCLRQKLRSWKAYIYPGLRPMI